MTMFQGAGALLTLIAIFGFINQRFFKLPDTLGITAVGLFACLCFAVASIGHPEMVAHARALVGMVDFSDLVFHGLLSLLLFAGALHVDLSRMRAVKLPVFLLATVGVVISTAVVGVGFHLLTLAIGHPVSLLWSLVFGALISPTDPIAVMSVLKNAGVVENVEVKIAGEALFNDGTAVVAFVTLLGLATGSNDFSAGHVVVTLLREVLGAGVLGLALGYGAFLLLRGMDSYPVEIMISLALATAGYSIAEAVHVSAPLAVVVMGLVIGNHAATQAMSEKTREHLFNFWHLLDELLNLVLFGLIGLEVIALSFHLEVFVLGVLAIPVVLLARALSVYAPLTALRGFREMSPHTVKIMTWGGLRGGISIALALSLPEFEGRVVLIGVTYVVTLWSLLVQATTLAPFIRRLNGPICTGHDC
ncbi:cation:proton antiporter [Burkholderia cenocepacia]|uniref:cation:proton antiporter n=1 Tax=Burkholderia cenocepacia TaxID=95486 RepID=UPI00076174D0|nr:sodium:proton antiporter [Burkholderia cenocepacia]KWU19027.1 sodium:proton antiporter [Burkholderia cenocepacia]